MKVLILASAAALATVLAFSPASARLGIAPMASAQDAAIVQAAAAMVTAIMAGTAIVVVTTAGITVVAIGGIVTKGGVRRRISQSGKSRNFRDRSELASNHVSTPGALRRISATKETAWFCRGLQSGKFRAAD